MLAADQFIITPAGRVEEAARARAAGDEVRTVIAGYHWFTDWGRDTMISLEGLTLATGRYREAGYILRTFAHYVRDGLIPNMFPEGENEGLYHTADATLWFFHAIDRYLHATGDREHAARAAARCCVDIVEHHLRGTRFGIGVDPADGLLRQGAEGYQLTWMDAKVGDWVVTPRRGKAVEINALWYNALRLLEALDCARARRRPSGSNLARARRPRARVVQPALLVRGGRLPLRRRRRRARRRSRVPAEPGVRDLARRIRCSTASAGSRSCDVVARAAADAGRPALARARASRLQGRRTTATCAPRDAAYHQGTVWALADRPVRRRLAEAASRRSTGGRAQLARRLRSRTSSEACVGSISEVFDAEAPYTPRGCIAQAWSVAEVLRTLEKTGEGVSSCRTS